MKKGYHSSPEGPPYNLGVVYHSNLKDKPRIIAVKPFALDSLLWVKGQGLYYADNHTIRKFVDGENDEWIGTGRDLHVNCLAWIPDYGLCCGTHDGEILRCTNENNEWCGESLITKRAGSIMSLIWIPEQGLFDAGSDVKYNQIRKCLDKGKNKVDELIAERVENKEKIDPLPTLHWIPEVGLIDKGEGHYDRSYDLVRYLNQDGNKCNELIAIKDKKLFFVDKKSHPSCTLFRLNYELLGTRSIMAFASVPKLGLLFTDHKNGIYKLLDDKGNLDKSSKPIINTWPHEVSSMAWINKK